MTSSNQSPLDWILNDVLPREAVRDAAYANAEADLEAYVELELTGQDADARYPSVRPTLEQHPELMEEYTSLRSLLAAQQAGLLVELEEQPDLYLPFVKEAETLWAWVQSGERRIARLLDQVSIQIGRRAATFGQLPAMLSPQIVAVPVRDAGGERATAEAVDLASPETDTLLRLQLGPGQQDRAIVSVQFQRPSNQAPARRARAFLLSETGQILISNTVDEAGWITFREIAPGSYTVRVSQGELAWELPLVIVQEAA